MLRTIIDMFLPEKDTKLIGVELPVNYLAGLDTMVWILDKEGELGITRDDVIEDAIYNHLVKNIWATKDLANNVTKIRRASDPPDPKVFGAGRVQRRG